MVFFKTWIIRSEAVLAWSRSIASYSFVVTTDTCRPMAAPSLRKSSRATRTSPRISASVAFRKSFSLIVVFIVTLFFLFKIVIVAHVAEGFLIVLIGFVIVRTRRVGNFIVFLVVLVKVLGVVLVIQPVPQIQKSCRVPQGQIRAIADIQLRIEAGGVLFHRIEVQDTDFNAFRHRGLIDRGDPGADGHVD